MGTWLPREHPPLHRELVGDRPSCVFPSGTWRSPVSLPLWCFLSTALPFFFFFWFGLRDCGQKWLSLRFVLHPMDPKGLIKRDGREKAGGMALDHEQPSLPAGVAVAPLPLHSGGLARSCMAVLHVLSRCQHQCLNSTSASKAHKALLVKHLLFPLDLFRSSI